MVPGGSVGRPRHGDARKERSVAAVRAYIASRLAGQLDEAFLTDELGIALNTTAVRRAAGPWHWRPPGYKPPGRAGAGAPPPSGTAMRDWLAVRAAELNLGLGLLVFPVAGAQAQRELYRALAQLLGVVHVLAAGDGRDRQVVALVLTDGDDDRRRLRSELDELGDGWRWDEVDHETVEPAVRTGGTSPEPQLVLKASWRPKPRTPELSRSPRLARPSWRRLTGPPTRQPNRRV